MSNEQQILDSLQRIERGLYGDKANGQKGVISRITEIEEYVEEDRAMKQRVGGAVWIIGAIWTALVTFIGWIINKV